MQHIYHAFIKKTAEFRIINLIRTQKFRKTDISYLLNMHTHVIDAPASLFRWIQLAANVEILSGGSACSLLITKTACL